MNEWFESGNRIWIKESEPVDKAQTDKQTSKGDSLNASTVKMAKRHGFRIKVVNPAEFKACATS